MSGFQPGDIVTLRSGGPDMTVDEMRTDGHVIVWWFVGSERMREAFHARCLRMIEKRPEE